MRERPARLLERLVPWIRSSGSTLVKTPPDQPSLENRLGQQEMADSAEGRALIHAKLLGYKVSARSDGITVLCPERRSCGEDLQSGDVVLAVRPPGATVLGLRATRLNTGTS